MSVGLQIDPSLYIFRLKFCMYSPNFPMHAACLDPRIVLDTITFITKCNSFNKINTKLSIRSRSWKQRRQCTYKRNIDARSRDYFCRDKAIIITYYERVSVAVVIEHAMRMRRTILPSVDCLALRYFPTLSHKRHVLRKKLLNVKRVFLFSRYLFLKHLPF